MSLLLLAAISASTASFAVANVFCEASCARDGTGSSKLAAISRKRTAADVTPDLGELTVLFTSAAFAARPRWTCRDRRRRDRRRGYSLLQRRWCVLPNSNCPALS